MKSKFEKMLSFLATIRPARHATQIQKVEQEAWLSKYAKYEGDFEPEKRSAKNKLAQIAAGAESFNRDAYDQLVTMGKDLTAALVEKANQPLDLTDGKLLNALQYADLVKLDYEQATSLAEQFRGNQRVLKLIQDKFKEKEILSGVDKLIYNPSSLEETFKSYAFSIAFQNGSPEGLMREITKYAALEGITDLPEVGHGDFEEAVRRGAGLKDPDLDPAKILEAANRAMRQSAPTE